MTSIPFQVLETVSHIWNKWKGLLLLEPWPCRINSAYFSTLWLVYDNSMMVGSNFSPTFALTTLSMMIPICAYLWYVTSCPCETIQSIQFEEGCSHSFSFQKEAGWITRADLRHLLERPGRTQPRTPQPHLQHSQITELLNALDPEHSGVIQLASLERLKPSITSAPVGNMASPRSPANTAELLDVPEETGDTAVCLYNHLIWCVCVHFLVAHFHVRPFVL